MYACVLVCLCKKVKIFSSHPFLSSFFFSLIFIRTYMSFVIFFSLFLPFLFFHSSYYIFFLPFSPSNFSFSLFFFLYFLSLFPSNFFVIRKIWKNKRKVIDRPTKDIIRSKQLVNKKELVMSSLLTKRKEDIPGKGLPS